MMLQMSQLAFSVLSAYDAANGSPLSGEIYPLIAPVESGRPFAVYQVEKSADFSKRGINDVSLEIVLVGKDHDALCGISDGLQDHIENNSPELHFESAVAGVNSADHNEFNITLRFNAKMY